MKTMEKQQEILLLCDIMRLIDTWVQNEIFFEIIELILIKIIFFHSLILRIFFGMHSGGSGTLLAAEWFGIQIFQKIIEEHYMKTDTSKEQGFVLTYVKFLKLVIHTLEKLVPNHDIAEELAHDVFLKLYEKRYELDPHSTRTINLLITVAKNRALDYLKKTGIENDRLREKYFEDVVFDRAFFRDIEDYYIEGEIISTLHDEIDSFSEEYRNVFIDKYFGGRKSSEIARRRRITKYRIRQVENNLHERIRSRLGKYF